MAIYAYKDDSGTTVGLYRANFTNLAPLTAANSGAVVATDAEKANKAFSVLNTDLRKSGLTARFVRLKTTAGARKTVICGTVEGLATASVLAGVSMVSGERYNTASNIPD